jgi:hypothetical protein
MQGLVMVRVIPHRQIHFEETKYMLFNVEQTTDTSGVVLTWNTVLFPAYHVKGCEWRSDGPPSQTRTERLMRVSPRHGNEIYETSLTRTSNFLRIHGIPDIYEYTVRRPNYVLPVPYYKVASGNDTLDAYHFIHSETLITESVPVAPVPLVTHAPVAPHPPSVKIPAHILRIFMDSAIEKKDQCPIEMEPFTKESIACTPCGHLFNRGALARSINSSNTCPTCRAPIYQGQNYFY